MAFPIPLLEPVTTATFSDASSRVFSLCIIDNQYH
jgi:hypothetical protein